MTRMTQVALLIAAVGLLMIGGASIYNSITLHEIKTQGLDVTTSESNYLTR